MNRIFLDAQSSTPLAPEVIEEMRPFLFEYFATPSSACYSAKKVRKEIEKAREQVASALGAKDLEEIIFTSSGTEANNLAIKGTLLARKPFGNHA